MAMQYPVVSHSDLEKETVLSPTVETMESLAVSNAYFLPFMGLSLGK
jgi:hypothetical protein